MSRVEGAGQGRVVMFVERDGGGEGECLNDGEVGRLGRWDGEEGGECSWDGSDGRVGATES